MADADDGHDDDDDDDDDATEYLASSSSKSNRSNYISFPFQHHSTTAAITKQTKFVHVRKNVSASSQVVQQQNLHTFKSQKPQFSHDLNEVNLVNALDLRSNQSKP